MRSRDVDKPLGGSDTDVSGGACCARKLAGPEGCRKGRSGEISSCGRPPTCDRGNAGLTHQDDPSTLGVWSENHHVFTKEHFYVKPLDSDEKRDITYKAVLADLPQISDLCPGVKGKTVHLEIWSNQIIMPYGKKNNGAFKDREDMMQGFTDRSRKGHTSVRKKLNPQARGKRQREMVNKEIGKPRFPSRPLISPKKVQTTIIREYKTSEQNASKALTSQRRDKGVLAGPSTDKKTDAKLLGKKPPSDGEVLAAKDERSGQAQEVPPS
ncbi:Microtubule-Associated Protein 10 [Manis pentadactyla]|nr:Microtubule-Associated Protein 10 [Manis pentadactyla]